MFDRYTVSISSILMVIILVLLGVHLAQSSSPIKAQDSIAAGGMDMGVGTNEQYQAVLKTDPVTVEAGKPFQLTLDILGADGKPPVNDFDEVHTKLLHLILVSEDLSQFLHVHPDYKGDGEFVLDDATLPIAANYIVFADFTPTGDHQQVVRMTLATQDAKPSSAELTAGPTEFTNGPLKITLDVPEVLSAGVERPILFHVADAATGQPLDSLDEYLGAAGHLVIVDESGKIYLHTHPADHDMSASGAMAGMTMAAHYGPDLTFNATFPGVSSYKMWLQVQYKGEIYTTPFVVNVDRMAEVPAEATAEAEAHG
ncbi:MAG: hypothetical protein ABI690_21310 [Chloroflexota bacterium]